MKQYQVLVPAAILRDKNLHLYAKAMFAFIKRTACSKSIKKLYNELPCGRDKAYKGYNELIAHNHIHRNQKREQNGNYANVRIVPEKIKPEEGYTPIPSCILNKCTNISIDAIGLYMVLLSLGPKWNYSIKGLAAISKEGEHKIRTCLHQLKDNDYITWNHAPNKPTVIKCNIR